MLEYFLILSKSFCSFAILGTLPEWPWQWNRKCKNAFSWFASEVFRVVLRCVSCQGELSRERYYNSKRICTANLRPRTSIFFLSNGGTTCIIVICVQSFFEIVLRCVSCQRELSRERYYNSKDLYCKLEAKDIYFLSVERAYNIRVVKIGVILVSFLNPTFHLRVTGYLTVNWTLSIDSDR